MQCLADIAAFALVAMLTGCARACPATAKLGNPTPHNGL